MICSWLAFPLALSLSKGCPSSGESEGQGFDRLSPSGVVIEGAPIS
jgi:hypothetical protein